VLIKKSWFWCNLMDILRYIYVERKLFILQSLSPSLEEGQQRNFHFGSNRQFFVSEFVNFVSKVPFYYPSICYKLNRVFVRRSFEIRGKQLFYNMSSTARRRYECNNFKYKNKHYRYYFYYNYYVKHRWGVNKFSALNICCSIWKVI
jgi:hypothetical protein